jgi:GNAT superfamily N-acetyltransferase
MGEVVSGDYSRWVQPDMLHSVTSYMLFKALFSSHNNNNLFELEHTVRQAVPQNGLPLFAFIDNHDQPRIASNVTNKKFLPTLYALMYTLPGIPSIYYGSEWGIEGVKEGGSDAPMRPYIDIGNRPAGRDDLGTPSLPAYLAKLAEARRGSNALKLGGYRLIFLEYQKPYVFERAHGDEKVAVAVNISGHSESVNLSGYSQNGLVDLLTGEVFSASQLGNIQILPHSARILAAGDAIPLVGRDAPIAPPVAAQTAGGHAEPPQPPSINIRAYVPHTDEAKLFVLMRDEGHEWQEYWGAGAGRYKQAIASSSVFVACAGDEIAGFVRAKDDNGFGVYIYDLLVAKPYRGMNIGRRLADRVKLGFPGNTIYVMSDVDEYYQKQGYERHGSIFEVR